MSLNQYIQSQKSYLMGIDIGAGSLKTMIIDLEGNIIFQSTDNVFSREDVFFKKNFNKKIEDFKELTGDLNIKINNISFAHYQLIKNYNYLILSAYNSILFLLILKMGLYIFHHRLSNFQKKLLIYKLHLYVV